MRHKKRTYGIILSGIILAGTANIGTSVADIHSGHRMDHGNSMPSAPETSTPAMPGQAAFGAIQEIVTILEADKSTNWANVDIGGLRSHLVDMDLLLKDAVVHTKNIEGGLEMVISGQDASKTAIQNMVSAHSSMIDGVNKWAVKSVMTDTGTKLTVTSKKAGEVAHIRGLGFFGIMVTDSHHQSHHLSLARGINIHDR